MSGLDWQGLQRAGLGQLRLSPDRFWDLTPFELGLMLGLDHSAPAMNRSRLGDLMARFPDLRKPELRKPGLRKEE